MPYLRGSWYSQLPAFGWFDPEDRPGSAAYRPGGRSIPDSQQGIALPSRAGLGKWYNVTPPGGNLPFPMQQTDIGPAKWTGRGVDISAAGAHQMGYTPKNFPTDAAWKIEPRDEPRGLGSPAGLPAQAGDIPDNTDDTAVASGPPEPRGRKMPASLLDMFQPQDASGQPTDFGGALRANSNSLVGMGMGLLQPRSLAHGAPVGSAWGDALQGYQTGSALDQRRGYQQAQLQQQKSQAARQAAMDRFNMGMREREFARGGEQDRLTRDLQERQFARGGEKPPETRERFDPALGRNIVEDFDPSTRQWRTSTTGGGTPTAGAVTDPFAAGINQPIYGQGGNYNTPVAPTASGAQAQPVLPPKKPLTAHEQTAVDKAEEALTANRAVIGNLRDAKKLSPKAASGPYALERGQMGQHLPGFLGAGGKETVELHNLVATNAIEQLKAVFGGNPTEGERKILIDLQGSVSASDEVRQKIFDRAIEAAERRLETNRQRAQQIRGGTYYNPGGGASAPAAAPAATGGGSVRRYNPATGKIE